ncbi:MAG: bifunctional glutamate N-acetyltransferase/amino-acid acetyltransferase ArgJ [Microvirga sp.]
MPSPVSPLAPKTTPILPPIEGVRIATAEAGIRYRNRTDVLYMTFAKDTTVGGVFTRSRCPSAPVDWCRKHLPKGLARALVVNSGNANAFTGRKGAEAVKLTADIAADAAGCRASQVFIASTGVIGEPLDASKFGSVLEACERNATPQAWLDAAKAIMTTDTFPKVATRTTAIGGTPVTLNGFAKGAGMIAPDMATMLAFVVTDAPIAAPVLQALLKKGADKSFNCVTVDSDTSTSDTLLLFATGAAAKRGAPVIALPSDRRLREFRGVLEDLLCDLARQVARDGEGARKFVTVKVTGATGATSARRIAMAIANSPLVKTAVAGEDANWGRVVMAVGKAGEPADRDRLAIWFGDIRVAAKGARDPDYDEARTTAYMKGDEITIHVDIGLGRGEAHAWTCDLTKAYVEINGDYRS